MLILASASPRRIEMLKNAGFDPVVKPASIIEQLPFDMPPETATMFLALSKAFAVADELTVNEDVTIIAADTVVVSDGRIIGKPTDETDAYRILERLRASSHHVVTGCCIINIKQAIRKSYCFYEDTEVFFKDYTDEELRAYVQTDEPYDKAGGYAIQGTFKKYIDHIEGDFDNVVGLPLTRILNYRQNGLNTHQNLRKIR